MSEEDRVEVVDALLRNRAMMLDPYGRPMPGVAIFGVVITDEEFRSRAREIVEATGTNQRAAVRLIDAFGEEIGERVERQVDDLERAVRGDGGDDLPPPPPPA